MRHAIFDTIVSALLLTCGLSAQYASADEPPDFNNFITRAINEVVKHRSGGGYNINYVPEPNELRFDMFDAEFTHEGDRCSFEVLLGRMGLDDPALSAIAEIVHDIDLKDEKFGREEAPGIKTLINGICADTRDDDERLVRGGAIFDNLYSVFSRKRGARTERKTES